MNVKRIQTSWYNWTQGTVYTCTNNIIKNLYKATNMWNIFLWKLDVNIYNTVHLINHKPVIQNQVWWSSCFSERLQNQNQLDQGRICGQMQNVSTGKGSQFARNRFFCRGFKERVLNRVQNLLQIALSVTVFEINDIFYFRQNSRWRPKFGKCKFF